MKTNLGICLGVSARYKTRIMSAKTGAVLKESRWQKNLILDRGLNRLAGESFPDLNNGVAQSFQALRIGSGTNPVKIASGGITFTQTGTTLTASGGFFTAAMAGGLFKWGSGSGGIENYIASYTSATEVQLVTSMTVAVPEVGVVWQVQTTTMQTLLFSTSTYQTSAGDNSCIFDGVDTVTFQRTFIKGVEASPYNVNELGFAGQTAGTNIAGRLVLSATDVVGTANFYVVVMQIQVKISPAVPTAVSNVGTGVDTAGTSMLEGTPTNANEVLGLFQTIQSTGASGGGGAVGLFDQGSAIWQYRALTADWTQRSVPTAADLSIVGYIVSTPTAWAKVSGVRGAMQKTSSTSITTAGETWRGIALRKNGGTFPVAWSLKFTTPGTLPVGNFQPITNIRATFDRLLVN